MNLFEDEESSIISAVIASNENIINSPKEKEEMGSNFIIALNPKAMNPLPKDIFNFGTHYHKQGNNFHPSSYTFYG